MMRAMVTYLLEKGKIETTFTRAKDVRSMAEKMITLDVYKRQGLHLAGCHHAQAGPARRALAGRNQAHGQHQLALVHGCLLYTSRCV